MAKQPAFNGIDYTPRTEKAKQAAEAARRPMDRHIHGVVQHQQRYPIFEVKAGGVTVDWTDHHSAAVSAFQKAQTWPKRLCIVHADGRRVLLDEVTQTGHRVELGAAVALAA